jgi:hypothetical protein
MKKEIADKWVKALRSGEFKQGREFLANAETNEYCCLGVLCELAIRDGLSDLKKTRVTDIKNNTAVYKYETDIFGRTDVLPAEVMEWADMVSQNGNLPEKILVDDNLWGTCLSFLNDNGATFKEIANIIEDKWEHL